ncbi:MAG: hypothetical protein JW922_10585 [Paludibacteraceae bacterium]|nr:hypothetical protein [Paludibacteraceae bacterium]
MSFLATLFLDNTERAVLNADILVRQSVDMIQRPNKNPEGGLINIKIRSTHEDMFFAWMVSPTMMKNGYIRFYKHDGMSRFADLEFWDCYLVNYYEHFSDDSPEAVITELTLSPGILRFKNIVFAKNWKVTDLSKTAQTAVAYNNILEDNQNSEKRIIRMYYTDTNQNEIDNFLAGDKIYLNIESENHAGDTIDINLDNKIRDFKYKGKVLENDTIKGYTISKDSERIELEVIDQQN